MTLHELIVAASEGDEGAWSAIVDRFEGLVWATTRAHRLSQAEAADVTQTTWLRLIENLDRIKEAERLGAWLATTARRELVGIQREDRRLVRMRHGRGAFRVRAWDLPRIWLLSLHGVRCRLTCRWSKAGGAWGSARSY
jgi:DNA-directed RNA polymerase specialized sigma24 family protein